MEQLIIPEELKNFKMKKQTFFEGEVTLMLPDFMNPMPEKENNAPFTKMFVSENTLVSLQNNAVFAIYKKDKDEAVKNAEAFTDAQIKVLPRMVPGYAELGRGNKNINGCKVRCVQYKSYAVDKDMNNIFFCFETDEKIIYGFFSTPYYMYKVWTDIFLTFIETLKIGHAN